MVSERVSVRGKWYETYEKRMCLTNVVNECQREVERGVEKHTECQEWIFACFQFQISVEQLVKNTKT